MPRTILSVDQTALYQAALEGLELQRQRIEDQIQSVRTMLGGRASRAASAPGPVEVPQVSAGKAARKQRRKRNLSPDARKRIAEAQKKRWAAYRSEKQG